MTFKVFWILCALNLVGWSVGWAGEPHLKNPVWVMIFWLHPLDNKDTVEINSIELGGEAVSPQICAALPMSDVLKPIDDAPQKIEAGLTPVVVCGIAAPTQTPARKPPVRSEPGHPDQPQGPSGQILYLPHRASFDVQGHQPASASEAQACHDSGGATIRVPGTGLFLECVHGHSP